MHIKIMKRVKDEKRSHHARAIFSYTSDFVPRVGELVDFKCHGPYEVVQVISCGGYVVVEVKDYNDPKSPPLSKCPTE